VEGRRGVNKNVVQPWAPLSETDAFKDALQPLQKIREPFWKVMRRIEIGKEDRVMFIETTKTRERGVCVLTCPWGGYAFGQRTLLLMLLFLRRFEFGIVLTTRFPIYGIP